MLQALASVCSPSLYIYSRTALVAYRMRTHIMLGDDCRDAINGWQNLRYFKTGSFRDAILSMILLKRITEGEPEPARDATVVDPTPPHKGNNQQPAVQPREPLCLPIDSQQHITLPPPLPSSISSLSNPSSSAPSPRTLALSPCVFAPTGVLSYTHTLSHLTGVIVDSFHLAHVNAQSVPAGINLTLDTYLDAYGYDTEAKLTVRHAYDNYDDIDKFIEYLSGIVWITTRKSCFKARACAMGHAKLFNGTHIFTSKLLS